MDILLLRHGEAADPNPSQSTDEARPLTKAGHAALKAACGTYAKLVPPPERILASPLLRASQSAQLLAEAFVAAGAEPTDLPEACDLITPASRPTRILERLHGDALGGTRCIALVGHEPHLGNLLGLLLTGSQQYPLPFRKGMLAWVRLESAQTMLGRLRLCLDVDAAAKLTIR